MWHIVIIPNKHSTELYTLDTKIPFMYIVFRNKFLLFAGAIELESLIYLC